MPINQFNVRPIGIGSNQETTSTTKKSGNNYNNYYYLSPEYERMSGGIGAGNSSYGLRATTNADGLEAYKELYDRTLGELISTLVNKNDTTSVLKYIPPAVTPTKPSASTTTASKPTTSYKPTTSSSGSSSSKSYNYANNVTTNAAKDLASALSKTVTKKPSSSKKKQNNLLNIIKNLWFQR